MAFTFTRYHTPIGPKHALIRDRLDVFAFKPIDPASEHDTAAGWCAHEGTHIDGVGTPDVGQYAAFGLRIDTLKIPPKVLKHHVAREVAAREKEGARVNRYQRAEVKENVTARLRLSTAPTMTHVPVVWDLDTGTVWLFSASKKVREVFEETFVQGFQVEPVPEAIFTRGLWEERDVESMLSPACWAATGCGQDEPSENVRWCNNLEGISLTHHLGPEFLAWLWWASEQRSGAFECWFDDRMVMSGATVEQTDTFSGGHPASSPEAREALRLGKMPESARLRIVRGAQEWVFTVKADMSLSGVKIPAVLSVEEDTALPERMLLLEQLDAMLWALVWQYVEARTAPVWRETFAAIQAWAGVEVQRAETVHAEPTAEDAALVLRETNVPIHEASPTMRPLLVAACKMTMGELLVAVEAVEEADGERGKLLRHVWERRREMGEFRETMASLSARQPPVRGEVAT